MSLEILIVLVVKKANALTEQKWCFMNKYIYMKVQIMKKIKTLNRINNFFDIPQEDVSNEQKLTILRFQGSINRKS